ncbi:MAG: M14 family metallopeptidase [Burkholderiaceae bacterium]|jgi:murein tripeptide amidase MpaA|nr:M14 family metallopeptidase [Burkholderiaceae bacterium]
MPAIDFSRFHRYDELMALLRGFAEEHPGHVEIGSIGRSHEGREIPLLTLTNRATGAARDKPAYWLDGNIHSVELTATTACLYFIDWMLKGRDGDADIRRALDTRAFYICPRINPDGAEWALADRPKYVRSSTRRYPFDEEPLEGLVSEDIDDDGRILQMRIADPNGAWKKHPLQPQLLVRRDPLDAPGGDYYRVLPEGRVENYDGVSIAVVGSAQGLDLNRNFPSNWRQEHEQFGAGPYPTSEPEVRAVVDFFATHPNICGGTSLHTFSGVLLRPFGHLPDDKMPAEDLWTYQKMGSTGEALTGYPAISIWHEFQYYPNQFISGAFDWIYEHLGMFMWTIEIWNPKKEAGIDNKEWIHWFRDHPIEDDLKVYDWAQRIAPGQGHVDWKPFDHPQLGRVEIGGWNRMALFSNPPPALREKEVARFPRWLLSLALVSPRLELRAVEATRAGADTWRVRLVVQNTGWLPSYVSKMAVQHKVLRGVLAEISLPAGAELVNGKPREELGELEGWAYMHTGVSFWPHRAPTGDRTHVDWIVRAPAGTEIGLVAWHDRAGRVETQVVLR